MACHGKSRFKAAAMKEQVYEFVRNIPRGKVAPMGKLLCIWGIGTLPGWWGIFFIAILIQSIFRVIG